MQTSMKPILAILVMSILSGCDPCGNTIKQSATSPDGSYVTTAFIRDCGATTSYSPQVEIGKPGKSISRIGKVFIGDHSRQIQVKWLSPTNLAFYSDCVVIRHITNFNGITITFNRQTPETM